MDRSRKTTLQNKLASIQKCRGRLGYQCRYSSQSAYSACGDPMSLCTMQYFPLSSAYLCQDCDSIGNCAVQCPACASRALMGLANVLDRNSEEKPQSRTSCVPDLASYHSSHVARPFKKGSFYGKRASRVLFTLPGLSAHQDRLGMRHEASARSLSVCFAASAKGRNGNIIPFKQEEQPGASAA
jgi:hypothetical protein